MNEFFKVKIDHYVLIQTSANESMNVKKSMELLVPAISYTDAETKIASYIETHALKNAEVSNLSKINISRIPTQGFEENYGEDENIKFYNSKVEFLHERENGSTKKVTTTWLIDASEVEDAVKTIRTLAKEYQVDYSIKQITETKFSDIVF